MSVPQSLPSFAQAFSSSSLSETTHISNALPPIQSRPPVPSKKRSRTSVDAHTAGTTRHSPILVRIKEEDMSPPKHNDPLHDDDAASAGQPLSKKRRVTVSAIPHPSSAEQSTVSPLHASFPTADDTIHSRPKQQQKPLVDQRKESISATLSTTGPSACLLTGSPPSDQLATSKLSRIGRISPTTISVVNRCAGNAVASGSQATTSSAQPMTPPPLILSAPAEPTSKPQQGPPVHSLPPPPISFARRRAAQSGGRKKKPADILISPRGAGPSDPLAPVIQSAPPVADPGRFPMAIPRLPLVLNNAQSSRRVAGNVPPTPTRFSLQGTTAPSISSTVRTAHSPPTLSVPITNTLVPPTPHALHHPGYTGDKSAFLAPFEVFYDALNDSKQLKSWLADQLQKSNTMLVSLKQQQDKMDEIVEDLVEKRTRVMREEVTMLRQRMESLEEALLAVRAESSVRGQDTAGYGYPQGAKFHQNGIPPVPDTPSSYRFPAPEQRRADTIIKVTSPEREREHLSSASPPVEVTRRLSVSGTSARPEPAPGLHNSFTLGGHNRSASSSQSSVKGTPPVRPQAIPERSTTARPTDTRGGSRLWSYGNSHPPVIEGQASSKT